MTIGQLREVAPLSKRLNDIEKLEKDVNDALANQKVKGIEDLKQFAGQVYANIPGGVDNFLADIREHAGSILTTMVADQKAEIQKQIEQL